MSRYAKIQIEAVYGEETAGIRPDTALCGVMRSRIPIECRPVRHPIDEWDAADAGLRFITDAVDHDYNRIQKRQLDYRMVKEVESADRPPAEVKPYDKLGLEKDIIIATIRSIIQLLIIGYILTFVFESDSPIFIILMIMLMIAAATQNIIKKGDGIPGHHLDDRPYPMVLSLLFLNKFKDEVDRSDETIELILSMGGQPKVAIDKSLKSAIQTSMIPTIEAQKTMGLVQLPGMMSGLIIGGADPMEAVMYQLLILFLILTTAAMSSVMVGYMAYPKLFNQKMQFMERDLPFVKYWSISSRLLSLSSIRTSMWLFSARCSSIGMFIMHRRTSPIASSA